MQESAGWALALLGRGLLATVLAVAPFADPLETWPVDLGAVLVAVLAVVLAVVLTVVLAVASAAACEVPLLVAPAAPCRLATIMRLPPYIAPAASSLVSG